MDKTTIIIEIENGIINKIDAGRDINAVILYHYLVIASQTIQNLILEQNKRHIEIPSAKGLKLIQ